MLKGVKKGIKKKIKGKKDKKEDDLFDPEQLEKYKRELEEAKKARQQADEESGVTGAGSSEGHEDDEEWLRFKQLTSGVDAIVNKASEDLDKIKESSFFQRNKPSEQNRLFAGDRPKGAIIPTPEQEKPPEGGQWVHIEGEEAEHGEVTVVDGAAAFGNDATDDPFNAASAVPESPAEIEPVELDDSLFDTTFVDAIASGEIKLAYIPDSPTYEDDDDPFLIDAGIEAILKKGEEEEKRQAKQVNLGDAVDVLTGKGNPSGIARPRIKAAETKAKARPRPHAVNLLGDFDQMPPSAPVATNMGNNTAERPKDIFDQLLDSPSKEGVGSSLLDTVDIMARKEVTKNDVDVDSKEGNKGIKDVISEFDIISQLDPISGSAGVEPLASGIPSSIPSSIAALLTTSTAPPPEEDDDLDDEFAALAAESIHKGPSPAAIVSEEPEVDEDPFDTSFVETTAAHGKCELKILENEFLGDVSCEKGEATAGGGGGDDDDFDFNPRLGESPPKTLEIQNAPKKNPLEDMSPMTVKAPAIEPQVKAVGPTLVETVDEAEQGGHEDYVDPFDTTKVETVLPGKAELKLLEAELMSVEQAKIEAPKLPETITSALIKNQKTQDNEDDFDFDPRKDEIKHHPLDLPDVGVDNIDTASEVLKPRQDSEIEIDPFDTSAVSGLIPGPLELKLLESELVTPTAEAPISVVPVQQAPPVAVKFPRTFSDDDFDFDPREGAPPPVVKVPPQTTEDIFDSTMDFAVDKPLTPQEFPSNAMTQPNPTTNVEDPFDTSCFSTEMAKSELRQVEEELLNAPSQATPQTRQLPVIVAVEFKKPSQPVVPDLPPEPSVPHPLEANTPVDHTFKPLTPVEVPTAIMSGVVSVFNPDQNQMSDPFDTSIAEGVIPGKVEIKLLESELGVGLGLQRRLSDPDFDPRQGP